ncbi:hypothetical protein ACFQ8C_14125 [Streptomyces sp. NPDC056503]|uniref:hypothetical protein n=1 Tax=Streptomyces sp. NPDC056503 TaxID=3345842 RepID=UPI0036827F2B
MHTNPEGPGTDRPRRPRARVLRSSWTPGALPRPAAPVGPVLVSVTDFRPDRISDLPGVHRAARTLAARWTELEGAYGMWLWTRQPGRRVGSVAVWRDEAALRAFVGWPPHVAIMRAYHGRGSLASTTWQAETYDPAAIWTHAHSILSRPRA